MNRNLPWGTNNALFISLSVIFVIHIMSAIRAGTSLFGRWTWWGLTRECAFWRARNIKNGGSTTKHGIAHSGFAGTCISVSKNIKGQQLNVRRHLKEQHGKNQKDITKNFRILRSAKASLKCFFIRMLKPKLKIQCDSNRAKVCV